MKEQMTRQERLEEQARFEEELAEAHAAWAEKEQQAGRTDFSFGKFAEATGILRREPVQ